MPLHIPDISHPLYFSLATAFFFIIITARYLLIGGIFYCIFYWRKDSRWEKRKINDRSYKKGQFRREVTWSMITSFIFALAGAISLLLWQKGYSKIYIKWNDHPLWWLPVSLVFALGLHETYYYWLHRCMHYPAIFRIVHKIHHNSSITSPWTAFSFHPIEGFFQAIFLPLLLLILPINEYVLLLQLTIMTFSSVINHLDIEIYPAGFNKNFIGKWMIGATHHSLHHRQYKYNYGLYFTFWDKWKKTESPIYNELFEEKAGKK